MQYGNKKKENAFYAEALKFKSYYVVWKLFKMQGKANIETLFKSYYVVWKRQSNWFFEQNHFSLNRTMQYGNPKSDVRQRVTEVSLNRTMQYGNKVNLIPLCSGNVRLNRTMQYGNERE